ncbi:MAG: VCBS repeat-containing protein, partial [candidate division Zixibacteria bacterium]|nr:VCBS repeat-containing protein [candidate division Zixibacteria bacterium]
MFATLRVMEVLVSQWRGHSCPRSRLQMLGFFNTPRAAGHQRRVGKDRYQYQDCKNTLEKIQSDPNLAAVVAVDWARRVTAMWDSYKRVVLLALMVGVGVCLLAGMTRAQVDHTLPILWHAQGATENTWFGMNAAGVGDVNHDGFDDIAVVSKGGTFVYYGGTTPDTVSDLHLPGLFGSITQLGDINGDGYPDIAGGNGTEILIFHGNATSLDTIPSDSLVPDVKGSGFGGSFGIGLAAADFDHDSLMDFVVVDGNPGLPGSMGGRILFYSGADGYGNHVRWAIPGATDHDRFTRCTVIDLDGDSLPELVVTVQGGEVG